MQICAELQTIICRWFLLSRKPHIHPVATSNLARSNVSENTVQQLSNCLRWIPLRRTLLINTHRCVVMIYKYCLMRRAIPNYVRPELKYPAEKPEVLKATIITLEARHIYSITPRTTVNLHVQRMCINNCCAYISLFIFFSFIHLAHQVQLQ